MQQNKKQITLKEIFSDAKKRELFIEESKLLILRLNNRKTIEHNKIMYEIFTPWYIQFYHRIKRIKPYLNLNYKPKF